MVRVATQTLHLSCMFCRLKDFARRLQNRWVQHRICKMEYQSDWAIVVQHIPLRTRPVTRIIRQILHREDVVPFVPSLFSTARVERTLHSLQNKAEVEKPFLPYKENWKHFFGCWFYTHIQYRFQQTFNIHLRK